MTSPGATIVGRVGIRVIPDVSRFREELRAKLAKMKDLTVEVNVEPDLTGFMAKVRAAAAAASRSTKVRVPVEADTRNFGQRLLADVTRWGKTLVVGIRDFASRLREANQQTGLLERGFNRVTSTIRSSGQALAWMSSQLARIRRTFRDGRFIPTSVGADGVIETRQVRGIALAWDMVRTSIDRARTSGLNFRGMLTGLQAMSRTIGSTLANGIRSAFRETLSGRDSFSLANLFKGVGQVLSGVGKSASGLLGIFLSLSKIMAIVWASLGIGIALAAAFAVAGAAITAAWGAISVAILAVLPAIALIGVPIAAVMLGLEGIKKAAKTLEPQFNKLKRLVEDAFVKGMTPAFKTLKAVFPTLNVGMVKVAEGLGSLTQRLAKFVTESKQLKRMKAMFENIADALSSTALARGLEGILEAFLRLGAMKEPFRVITGLVEELGVGLNEMVTRLSGGTLQSAFRGLEGTLRSLSAALVALIANGVQLYAKAAPGVNKFIDDLTGFFNRFDWDRLGVAVGRVFSGIGEAIRKIDDSTIEKITAAFEKIGELFETGFENETFLAALDTLGVAFDEVVETVKTAMRELGPAFKEIQPFIQEVIKEIGQGLRSAIETIGPYLKDLAKWLSDNKDTIAPMVPYILAAAVGWKAFGVAVKGIKGLTELATGLGKIGGEVTKFDLAKLSRLTLLLGRLSIVVGSVLAVGENQKNTQFDLKHIFGDPTEAENSLKNTLLRLTGILTSWVFSDWQGFMRQIQEQLRVMFPEIFGEVPDLIGKAIGPVPGVVGEVLGEIPRIAGDKTKELSGVIQPGLTSAGATMRNGVNHWTGTVNSGMGTLNGSVQTGMANANGSVQAGTANMNGSMRQGMTGFSNEARTGVNNANTNVQSGVTQMQSQVRTKSSSFTDIGRFLMQGLINGINAMVGPLVSAAAKAALAAFNAAKAALGIKSPSKLFAQLGKWSVLGAVSGLSKTTPKLVKSAEQMVAKVADAASGLRSAFEIDGSFADRLSSIDAPKGRMDSFVRTQVESEGFGGIADKVAAALEGWTVDIDGSGMAKMVNKSNTRNRRR